MTRIASWFGVNVRFMKPVLVPIAVWLDDWLGHGIRNPLKKWWLDMEIVDGEILFHGTGSPWADYLGFSVDEVKSKPFLNFVYPDDLDIARETVSNIVEGRNVKDVTVRLNTKAGDFVKIDFSALIKGNTWFWFARKLLIDEEIN